MKSTEDKKADMDLVIGSVLDGKVTGITKFGAFVALPEGKSGMVHISEVAHSYVSDIKEFLKEGQEVAVKIIKVDDEGRINLSIKKAQPAPQEGRAPSAGSARPMPERRAPRPRSAPGRGPKAPVDPSSLSFEDKLKHFMQDSESRLSDIKHGNDRRSGARRKK